MARSTKRPSGPTDLTTTSAQLPADWEKELAEAAQEAAARELAGGGNWISIQGGRFSFQDEVLEEPLRVVVIDDAYDNAYYEGAYDPNNKRGPICYAVGRDVTQLAPPELPGRQNPTCAGCWANEFRSSGGKGKACKNARRILVVSQNELLEESPTIFTLRLPPTALRPFAQYSKKLAAIRRPVWSVITELRMEAKGTYGIPVATLGGLLGVDGLARVKQLRQQAGNDVLDTGSYQISNDSDDAAPAKSKKGVTNARPPARTPAAAARGKRKF